MNHGETVIVRRREQTGVDRDNTPVYGPTVEHEICGVGVEPRTSNDVNDAGRAGAAVGLTLYMPFDADIQFRDQVVVRGDVYDVDGEPAQWRSPFSGWEPGAVVQVNRVRG